MSKQRGSQSVKGQDKPLTIATLFPFKFPPESLPATIADRPVQVRSGRYLDTAAARNIKAAGAPESVIRASESPLDDRTRTALAEAEVVLALDLPLSTPDLAPQLQWVQAYGAGIGQLLTCLSGVTLTSAAGVGSAAIAEFVIARLLQVNRRLRDLDERQRERDWSNIRGEELAGKTMLLIGLGAIGSDTARLARAFGMKLLAVRRRPELSAGDRLVDEVHPPSALLELLPRADVVVLCAPGTRSTDGMIGERQLASMKPNAVLVNVARGALIDEPALIRALHEGRLRAAVLDVTTQEPLPPEHEFWGLENVYLSPHTATSMDGYLPRLLDIFIDNLSRYANGEPLLNAVDPAFGY
ncbi:D-2-hydroxyacid dehydrogenase [Jatrophihabitans sp. DSM 45814]